MAQIISAPAKLGLEIVGRVSSERDAWETKCPLSAGAILGPRLEGLTVNFERPVPSTRGGFARCLYDMETVTYRVDIYN